MADFFHLQNQKTEDKVINRLNRVYADSLKISELFEDLAKFKDFLIKANPDITGLEDYIALFKGGDLREFDIYLKEFTGDLSTLKEYTLKPLGISTTSCAKKLKIKMFIDALEVYDIIDKKISRYRIGEYYELEHLEKIQIFNSSGFYQATYRCIATVEEGGYSWYFMATPIPNKVITFYLSAISFEDSFYNPDNGWMNVDNPNNIITDLIDEVNPGLPAGASVNDFLVHDAVSGPTWKDGDKVVEFLPLATKDKKGVITVDDDTIKAVGGKISATKSSQTQYGIVKVDNTTIVALDGVISAAKSSPTQHGIVKVDNTTIVALDGVISAVGGGSGGSGGINYKTSEQDTGLKWVDNKNVFQITLQDAINTDIVLTGVDTLISVTGEFMYEAADWRTIPAYFSGAVYGYMTRDETSGNVQAWISHSPNFVTMRYTKK